MYNISRGVSEISQHQPSTRRHRRHGKVHTHRAVGKTYPKGFVSALSYFRILWFQTTLCVTHREPNIARTKNACWLIETLVSPLFCPKCTRGSDPRLDSNTVPPVSGQRRTVTITRRIRRHSFLGSSYSPFGSMSVPYPYRV